MREVRASGAFADGPDVGRTGLQPIVHAKVATTVQLDTGLLEPDPGGVRRAPHRDEEGASLDALLPRAPSHSGRHVLSGAALHTEGLPAQAALDPSIAENQVVRRRNVG